MTTLKIYASYGHLAHEKHPVYTYYAPSTDIHDTVTVVIPDGVSISKSIDGGLIVEIPGAPFERYRIEELLTNRGDDPVLEYFDGSATRCIALKPLTVRDILTATGMTQAALAARFEIPLRTVESWAEAKRNPPPYVLAMMAEILEMEVKHNE